MTYEGMYPKAVGALVGLVLLAALGFYVFGGRMEKDVAQQTQQINAQIEQGAQQFEDDITKRVVFDSWKQYEIARDNGSAMDAYVAAGLHTAACLQSKNEEWYKRAKAIERMEAKRAGMPVEK